MISDNSKNLIQSQMKNVEVVSYKRKLNQWVGKTEQINMSTDDLKNKYMSLDEKNNNDKLRKKFLSGADDGSSNTSSDTIANSNPDNDDVEVGLIKSKNQDAGADANTGERTIIVSKRDGMLGSQG